MTHRAELPASRRLLPSLLLLLMPYFGCAESSDADDETSSGTDDPSAQEAPTRAQVVDPDAGAPDGGWNPNWGGGLPGIGTPPGPPSPDNHKSCPATAPANPIGSCLGTPVYALCSYGNYHCLCDWVHWLCVGIPAGL